MAKRKTTAQEPNNAEKQVDTTVSTVDNQPQEASDTTVSTVDNQPQEASDTTVSTVDNQQKEVGFCAYYALDGSVQEYELGLTFKKDIGEDEMSIASCRAVNIREKFRVIQNGYFELLPEIAKGFFADVWKSFEGVNSMSQFIMLISGCAQSTASELVKVASTLYNADGSIMPGYDAFNYHDMTKIARLHPDIREDVRCVIDARRKEGKKPTRAEVANIIRDANIRHIAVADRKFREKYEIEQKKIVDSRVPERSESTVDNKQQDIPEGSESTVDNKQQDIPEGSESTVDNKQQDIPEGSESTVDNKQQDVPERSESTVDNKQQETFEETTIDDGLPFEVSKDTLLEMSSDIYDKCTSILKSNMKDISWDDLMDFFKQVQEYAVDVTSYISQ